MKTVLQKRPILITLILGLLAAFFVQFAPGQAKAGWKEEWSAVVAKANQEGKVVVWGPPGQLIRKGITDGFSKAFPGISIEYTGNRSSKFVVKIRAERKGGVHSVDVLLTGASTLALRFKPSGALDPIGPALILPEVTDPSKWRNNHLEYADTEQKYVLSFVSMVSPVMNYNPKQVKPSEIDELYELLDPKWKGKILINDPIPLQKAQGPGGSRVPRAEAADRVGCPGQISYSRGAQPWDIPAVAESRREIWRRLGLQGLWELAYGKFRCRCSGQPGAESQRCQGFTQLDLGSRRPNHLEQEPEAPQQAPGCSYRLSTERR
jgi:hypothetical protein